MAPQAPLSGVRVVEVAIGTSAVGSGLAVSLPGSLLRDLGAEVARIESKTPSTLDAGIELTRAWNRGKDVTRVDDDRVAAAVAAIAKTADIFILNGSEARLERQNISY